MKYEILDVTKLTENYATCGWVVVCDEDANRAHTAGIEEPEDE